MQQTRLDRGQQIRNDCQINQLTAAEPSYRIESEAGVTEIWEPNQQEELKCAGVTVIRHQIEPKGLALPHYVNAPIITYVVNGRGILGVNISGFLETYESAGFSEQSFSEERRERGHERREKEDERRERERGDERREREDERRERGSQRSTDQHQKVRCFRQGDIIALPAGVSKWVYNDGQERLTLVSLYDTNNFQNKLDENLRLIGIHLVVSFDWDMYNYDYASDGLGRVLKVLPVQPVADSGTGVINTCHQPPLYACNNDHALFLAGNPQGRGGEQGRHQETRCDGKGGRQEENLGQNIFSGFDDELLADAFEVDQETIRSLKGQDDNRGAIVRVERDLKETLCSLRLKENIDNPENADVFNPHGGRLTSLNSHKFPILNFLQLSAEKVNLYKNAILAPHWRINAHTICYFTRGEGRIQVVNHEGHLVFDDTVNEGQLLVIPQNFAVVKRAGHEGLEWVSFLTNDESMMNPLAGRISAIRGMPEEVLMNSYGISRDEAKRLKYSRPEFTVFSPSSSTDRRRDEFAIV
ncbi:hypothetical protein RND81_05G063400 [Saponaria officinalis]|uniref:Cupin type-1 domain-containing protein n=1 Tax=Saponaria officinalis TaxID=3572 RepID=A0AAW1KW05_SAPOF